MEDESIVRMVVIDHLANLGYSVIQAADAEEALVELRNERRIDLLLTDVGLLGIGRQLAAEARKLRPDMVIIFDTGYADGAGSRSDLVGADMDLTLKPFTIDDLAHRVAALLARTV